MSGMGAPTLTVAKSKTTAGKATVSISASYLTGINEFFIFYTTDGTTPTSTSTYFDFGGGGTATIDVAYGITFKCMVQNRSNLSFSQVGSITIPSTITPTSLLSANNYFAAYGNYLGLTNNGTYLFADNPGSFQRITTAGVVTTLSTIDGDGRGCRYIAGRVYLCGHYVYSTDPRDGSHFTPKTYENTYWDCASDGINVYVTANATTYLTYWPLGAADTVGTKLAVGISGLQGIAFYNDTIYASNGTGIYSINKSTGAYALVYSTSLTFVSMEVYGNYIYMVCPSSGVYRYNPTLNTLEQIYAMTTNCYSLTIMNNIIYVGIFGGYITTLTPNYAAVPTASVTTSTISTDTTVTLSCTTTDATIYYTTDGTAATTASNLYVGPITISNTTTLNFCAARDVYVTAGTTATYTYNCAAPTISLAAGTYTTAQSCTLTTTSTDASIYYTTDGTTPTSASTLYSSAITVDGIASLKVIAVKSGCTDSAVSTTAYTFNCSNISISLVGGTYNNAQTCTLTTSTVGASIYYTTDLSNPSSSKTLYTGAITVDGISGIRAIAIKSGYIDSGISAAAYTFTCLAPTINWSATPYSLAPGSTWTDTLGANSINLLNAKTSDIPVQFYYNPVSGLIEWYARSAGITGIHGYNESTHATSTIWSNVKADYYLIGIDSDGTRYLWNAGEPKAIYKISISGTYSTLTTNFGGMSDGIVSQLYKSGNSIYIVCSNYPDIYYSNDNGVTWGYNAPTSTPYLTYNVYFYNSNIYIVAMSGGASYIYKYTPTTSTSVTLTKVQTLDTSHSVNGSFCGNKFIFSKNLGSDTPLKYCNLDNGTITTIGTPVLSSSYPTQVCYGALLTSKYFYWFGADTIPKVHVNQLSTIQYLTAPQTVTFEISGTTGATNTYTLGTASAVAYTGETSVTIGNNAASETITATASKTGYASASASITMPIIRANTYYAYTNGAWGTVSSASVYTGGAWKNALGMWKMISGTWTEIC